MELCQFNHRGRDCFMFCESDPKMVYNDYGIRYYEVNYINNLTTTVILLEKSWFGLRKFFE